MLYVRPGCLQIALVQLLCIAQLQKELSLVEVGNYILT